MPYEDPDPTDPMALHGVMIETDDAGAMREMATCFVEEYARMGFSAERITQLFRTRGYAGPFMAYQALGEKAVEDLITECLAAWGPWTARPRLEIQIQRQTNGDLALPVLEVQESFHE